MFSLCCTNCDWQAADADLNACPQCGATIDLHYPSPAIVPADQQPGIWRYASHLPLADLQYAVSLGEGNTALLQAARIGTALGLPELYFKLEGSNPTGSYKDRIAAVGISCLLALGKRGWAAIAAYGACAGSRSKASITATLFCLRVGWRYQGRGRHGGRFGNAYIVLAQG